jgi:hypothetical protein
MKNAVRLIVAMGLSLIAGCTTITEAQFNNTQAIVGGSPKAKRMVIADCIRHVDARPLAQKQSDALIMNIGMTRFAPIYCNRLWNALAAGRITYADYLRLKDASADNSKVLRIMQGR